MFLDIIDRRKNPKGKSLVNRQRFLRRHSKQIREAIREKVRDSDVKDIASNTPKQVKISTGGTEQPVFRHGNSGVKERVLPGNKEFVKGDKLPRQNGGKGRGTQGAPDGDGEDDFVFEVSQEEFLEYFFEGLELPDLVKRVLSGVEEFKTHRAGFTTDGPPNNLDPVRTLRRSQARRLAFRMPKLRRKHELEETLAGLEKQLKEGQSEDDTALRLRIEEVNHKLSTLERQIKAVPFLDEVDIRYRRHERIPVPVSQAVMFCILDVSGSMGQWEKEMAKRFFMLLYLFLTRNYEKVDVVFIRHHHTAKEVEEEEFFTSRESGGTVVSTALNLMKEIIDERYPVSQWNIYGCQASDGDNFLDDCPVVTDLMLNTIMPLTQYYAYVEVDTRKSSELWEVFLQVIEQHRHCAMTRITDARDIYPVFRGLFEKERKADVHHS